jgi:hypothetical protein
VKSKFTTIKIIIMKQVLNSIVLVLLLSFVSVISFAQEEEQVVPTKSKWVSDKGYWVIESNKSNPKSAVIHFYNNDNTEIYSEQVEGVKLNVAKRKTLKLLKTALEASLLAWEKVQLFQSNDGLVMNMMKAK